MSDTLVLSTAFQPISTIPWTKAFCLLFTGKVEVIKYHSDRVIHTVNETFYVPAVVRFVKGVFLNHKRPPAPAKYNRRNVFIRDKGKCQYCFKQLDKNNYTLDHVKPFSKGGKSDWLNIVTCCHECNGYKNNMTPQKAGMTLHTKPYVPSNIEIESARTDNKLKDKWKEYLDEMLGEI
jgi:5-methylcytosine-specific restriction endonuclease McrA